MIVEGKPVVKGLGASRGIVKGIVFLAFSPKEAMEKVGVVGDVLVTSFTDPTWTTLFPRLKAVITDIGGMLSHAAIVSRELGIPSVVGTGNATSLLKDGDCVVVDGYKGEVYKCGDS